LPVLAEVVRLKRDEAAALADGDTTPYDALLDDFEPETRADEIAALFAALRPRLAGPARPRAGIGAERQRRDSVGPSSMPRPRRLQLGPRDRRAPSATISRPGGRIDKAVHPFTSRAPGRDVRITTRIDRRTTRWATAFTATIHETGHAAYEQAHRPRPTR
jgi:carboxypeptidase Taq